MIFLLVIDGSFGRKTCLKLEIIDRVYAANSSDVNFSELYRTNKYCYLPSLF